jgi:hypothetical protein
MFNSPQDNTFAFAGTDFGQDSPLMQMLLAPSIMPGSEPGYQLCKTIYTYHPLGAILADAPIARAQSQERVVKVPVLGQPRMIDRFWKVWDDLGDEGATVIIHDHMSTSRRYGIASLGVGEVGKTLDTPLDVNAIAKADLYFNILDPLNTAGSLILSQDPNSPLFLKPSGSVNVQGVRWHPSRLNIKTNERPIYIDWSNPSFGFSGRSVYQRALFPMKSFIQTMITDDMITKKAGLLIAKMKQPGPFVDEIMRTMFGSKRGSLKSGNTGQVLGIGVGEEIETLNFTNLEAPYKLARENVLKNIASASGTPASIIAEETLTEGFGEGSEDFKKEVQYLNFIRKSMAPIYRFMDQIVMRRAWTDDFFESLKPDYAELREMNFETWLHQAMTAFISEWPNLNEEPESEKSKTEKVKMEAVTDMLEQLLDKLDPENQATLIEWATENVNERETLFASKLILDPEKLIAFLKSNQAQQEEMLEAAAQGKAQGEEAASPAAA